MEKIKLILQRFLVQSNPFKIALIICLIFLLFYSFQIPSRTSNSDVLIYSSRSGHKVPITDYAFYNETINHERSLLPNYHMGHTLVLWSVYHLIPQKFRNSIWPSGFVSAVCLSISIGLTFLFFLQIGFTKINALYIAVITGIIPSFWFHALIGEVYAMQFLFVLLFAYFFYKDKILLSGFFFLFSVLVTPLSALSISFIFYRGFSKKVFFQGMIISGTSLLLYLGIYYLIGSNILNVARPLNETDESISFLKNKFKFIVIILLNFGFYLIFITKGFKNLLKSKRTFLLSHIAAIAPQLALQVSYGGFNEELGSFHLIFFWGFVPLIVAGMSETKSLFLKLISPLFLVFLFQSLWMTPNIISGQQRYAAGKWIRSHYSEDVILMGDWQSVVGITQARLGWDLELFEKNTYEYNKITDKQVTGSGKDSLIIAITKRPYWRQLLEKIPLQYFAIKSRILTEEISVGEIKPIYENDILTLYYWKKQQENP